MFKEDILISIIVPVYKIPEEYLRQCINSIIYQAYNNIEVILVDDGSPDNCGEICDEYAKADTRVKVIHKGNGGVSEARNDGIKIATGEFVLFIDSDDFIEEDSLSKIVAELKLNRDIDVMFLEAYKYFTESGKAISLGDGYDKNRINYKTKIEVLTHITNLPKFPSSPCTKLIRKKFLFERELFFPKGIRNEDLYWTIQLFVKANEFSYCDTPYYYYRQDREGSFTNTKTDNQFIELYNFVASHSKEDLEDLNEYKEMVYSFVGFFFPILLTKYDLLDQKTKFIYRSQIKTFAFTMGYRNDKKTRLIRLWYNVFGLNMTAKVLRIYLSLRNQFNLG